MTRLLELRIRHRRSGAIFARYRANVRADSGALVQVKVDRVLAADLYRACRYDADVVLEAELEAEPVEAERAP